MAFSISSALGCSPKLQLFFKPQRNNITTRHLRTSIPCSPSSSLQTSISSISYSSSSSLRTFCQDRRVICFAASTFGSSGADGDWDPYEVLGVNPIAGFDRVKTAYNKKRKDAERNGDQATAALLERAYDKIMMSQLTKRKKGETFGSFQVSKDIKYADKEPIIPWGPRFNKSENKDIQINMAISSAFSAWLFFVRDAQWTPLQFMTAIYVYRIFEKLRAFEASPSFTEEGGEDDDRMLRMGKRLLRSCCLVFGCVAFASVGFTLLLNLIEFTGNYIPAVLYSSQDIFVTVAAAAMLFITASYYR